VTKKGWTNPELIVLTRSKPEEAVLQVCKDGGAGWFGPEHIAIGCDIIGGCNLCSAHSST
jgi:hypothetical protein